MSLFTLKRLLQLAPVVAALAIIIGSAKPASADVSCFQDLAACYQRAAGIESFWLRWAAGLDCELTAAECVREAIGY